MAVNGQLERLNRRKEKDAPLSLLVKEGSRRKEKELPLFLLLFQK